MLICTSFSCESRYFDLLVTFGAFVLIERCVSDFSLVGLIDSLLLSECFNVFNESLRRYCERTELRRASGTVHFAIPNYSLGGGDSSDFLLRTLLNQLFLLDLCSTFASTFVSICLAVFGLPGKALLWRFKLMNAISAAILILSLLRNCLFIYCYAAVFSLTIRPLMSAMIIWQLSELRTFLRRRQPL